MLKAILVILVLLISLSAFAIYQNKVPLNDPPGAANRLLVYLTQHIAQTSDVAQFPELRTRTYERTSDILFDELIPYLIHMGWEVQGVNKDNLTIHAVVSTPLIGFKDDVRIRLEPVGKKQTRMHIRSSSRVGHADFGANLGHILQLYQEMKLADLQ